ncbi:MAG: hypothetical protein ACC682_11405, partial [Gemmatimonadota bacterium]
TPYIFRTRDSDGWHLGPIHERLGQLYEEEGENGKSVEHYMRLVRLWDMADERLQARVETARARAEALLSEGQ